MQVNASKCTPHMIVKIVKTLPFNKVPGPDRITAVKLKILTEEPVTDLLRNQSPSLTFLLANSMENSQDFSDNNAW